MDSVSECARAYRELKGKEYIITLEGDLVFSIYFSASAFCHLLGLEKLTDVQVLKGKKPNQIYSQILRGIIPDSVLSGSDSYYRIADRVEHFDDIFSVLDISKSNKVIVDFDVSKLSFETLLKNTKYILYKMNPQSTSHLTIGQRNEKLYPETFIVEASNQYLSEQTMLEIIDIEIKTHITKNTSKETDNR